MRTSHALFCLSALRRYNPIFHNIQLYPKNQVFADRRTRPSYKNSTRNFAPFNHSYSCNSLISKNTKHCLSPQVRMLASPEPECAQRVIDSQIFKDIFTPELKILQEICERNKMDIRIAGGAARDILLGNVPHDIDFATTAHPEEMAEIFTKEGVRILEYGARAISHGTVSVRLNDTVNYEITTTRSDVLTDGRHATVEFHRDWRKDANRRDLTINSMFLGFDGTLYDYFNGYNDLMNKRVLFVGDADARIKEDFLRIMRYFRFYGRIKALPEDHDLETLEVIGKNSEGLRGVSGERIWVELKKIIQGHFADHQIAHIVELGVGENIGLPADCNPTDFAAVYTRTAAEYDISESALLSSLLYSKQQVEALNKRLKISKVELNTMLFIVEERDNYKPGDIKHYQDYVIDNGDRVQCLLRCIQLAAYMDDKSVYSALKSWDVPKFPFSAKTFIDGGIPKGKRISRGVDMVRQKWKDSDYKATHEQLVEYAQSIIKSGEL